MGDNTAVTQIGSLSISMGISFKETEQEEGNWYSSPMFMWIFALKELSNKPEKSSIRKVFIKKKQK